jgi:hypothetical protein
MLEHRHPYFLISNWATPIALQDTGVSTSEHIHKVVMPLLKHLSH